MPRSAPQPTDSRRMTRSMTRANPLLRNIVNTIALGGVVPEIPNAPSEATHSQTQDTPVAESQAAALENPGGLQTERPGTTTSDHGDTTDWQPRASYKVYRPHQLSMRPRTYKPFLARPVTRFRSTYGTRGNTSGVQGKSQVYTLSA